MCFVWYHFCFIPVVGKVCYELVSVICYMNKKCFAHQQDALLQTLHSNDYDSSKLFVFTVISNSPVENLRDSCAFMKHSANKALIKL